ncbi:hypothetical protein BXO88_16210, partial [Oribacterium sp. C9]
ENTDNELVRMLTDLFDERIDGVEKVKKLKSEYGLRMTKEVEGEVTDMCTYATAMENKGVEKGIGIGREQGIDIGREQGIGIGLEAGKRALVEEMLRSGMAPQDISSSCKLSLDYVLEIQKGVLVKE